MPALLAQVLTPDLAAACLIVILAGIARGFTGFAAGLVNVALLTLLYGPLEAIIMSALLAAVSSTMMLRGALEQVQWREAGPVSIAIAVGSPIGAALLLVADPTVVKPFIGAFVIASGLWLIAGWRYPGPRNRTAALANGFACGVATGFTGCGGPISVFYFLASNDPTPVQRANIAVAVAILVAALLISLAVGGAVGWDSVVRALLLFPGTVLGTWIGMRLFVLAPQKVYQHVTQWVLVAIGLSVMVSSLA